MAQSESAVPEKGQPFLSEVEEEIDSIRVRVVFRGLKKGELDVSRKTIGIHGMLVPMPRFGSWILRYDDTLSVQNLVQIGGAAAAFVYALHRTYPDICAWMSEAKSCTFTLEVEKSQKMQILKEIGKGKMQETVQDVLNELSDPNFSIKAIILLPEKRELKSQPCEQLLGDESASCNFKKAHPEQAGTAHATTISVEHWLKYKKFKGEIGKPRGEKEKLKQLFELVVLSIQIGKFDCEKSAFAEMKSLIRQLDAPLEEIQSTLEKIREVSQLLEDRGRPAGAAELALASSNLIRQIEDQDDRVLEINDWMKIVCKTIAKIFKVKTTTIIVSVGVDDELTNKKLDLSPGTKYQQATRIQKRGKKAFKNHDFAEALRCFDDAARIDPERIIYRLEKAEVFWEQGEYEECKSECQTVLNGGANDETKARAKELLGDVEYREYKIMKAFEHYKEAVELVESGNTRCPAAAEKSKMINLALAQSYAEGCKEGYEEAMMMDAWISESLASDEDGSDDDDNDDDRDLW